MCKHSASLCQSRHWPMGKKTIIYIISGQVKFICIAINQFHCQRVSQSPHYEPINENNTSQPFTCNWIKVKLTKTLMRKMWKETKTPHRQSSSFHHSQTCNGWWERVNKDEILISKGNITKCVTWMQKDCLGEASKCVGWGHQRLLSRGHCRHQGHHRNDTQCRGVSTAMVITDDNCHQRREGRKSREAIYTHTADDFVRFVSLKHRFIHW